MDILISYKNDWYRTKMTDINAKRKTKHRGTWVQTERRAHEAWAALMSEKGCMRAAQLLHVLVSSMADKNAVVASHKTLAGMCGASVNTVKRAISILIERNWIQVVRVGSDRGGVNAYVVNSRVAWSENRDKMNLAIFSASIVASADEQPASVIEDNSKLHQLPTMYLGEKQLPAGDGEDPPAQPTFDGLEPDLPTIIKKPTILVDENGITWWVDRTTGELRGQVRQDRDPNTVDFIEGKTDSE